MTNKSLNSELGALLTGRSALHLVSFSEKHKLHPETRDAFIQLQSEAKREGFDLQLVSSFRDYERQKQIWNRKAQTLSLAEILRWSAIPGASRHHWGTDVDIYDAARTAREDVQLSLEESELHGPFYELHRWLTDRMAQDKSFGFYRPYSQDRGGVSPEPWHISYAPRASELFSQYSFDLFYENILTSDILLKDELVSRANEIFKNYFQNIDFA